ncbi:flagellar biosynthetic protein FliO [bacterium]|nr:flagellar biosynthetic protein FliO [bacterium]
MTTRWTILIIFLFGVFCTPALADPTSENVVQQAAPSADAESVAKLRRIRESAGLESSSLREAESKDSASTGGLFGRAVQGLFLCLGAFGVLLYFLKRGQGRVSEAGAQRMVVQERIVVAPKASVALLQVDGRELLIGITESQITFFPGDQKSSELLLEKGRVSNG